MSTTKTIVSTPDGVPPMPVFSQAVISRGFVFVSGNIGCLKDTTYTLVDGGVGPQTRVALENLQSVLRAAGSDLKHIVKANIYLQDMPRDFAPMNEVYIQFFDKKDMPARTCVGVANLPMGALVEIECTAEIPS